MIQFTPAEIHKIAHELKVLKQGAKRWGIHWETVQVTVQDGKVFVAWEEDQGDPILQRVPCCNFVLELQAEAIRTWS